MSAWPAQLQKAATATTAASPAMGKSTAYNASSGVLAPTLPALTTGAVATALAAGQLVRTKVAKSKSDTSTNAVTVTCAGSDTFESGATTLVLAVPGEKVTLQAGTIPGGSGPVWIVEEHTAPRDVLDGRYTGRKHPTTIGAGPGLTALLPREVVGIDTTADQGYTIDSAAIYQVDVVSTVMATMATQINRGLPPNVTAGGTIQKVHRWNGKLYCYGFDATNSVTKVFQATPIPAGTTGNLTWTPVLTLTAGATGIPTALNGDAGGNYLYVGEYGDPSGGASIWRTADGTTWTKIRTVATRHCHGVNPDPFNAGHVYATWGDGQGTYISRSTDNGATWTELTTNGLQQSVQISFDATRVYFAADSDYGSAFFVERSDPALKVRALSPFYHFNLPVPPQMFTDGYTSTANANLTSFGAQFTAADQGLRIDGPNIPAGTTIQSVTSASVVVLSQTPTSTLNNSAIFYITRPNQRYYNKAWFGAVDPATGVYYFVCNASTTGGNVAALFCIPSPGMQPALLERFQGGALDPLILYGGYVVSGRRAFPMLAL